MTTETLQRQVSQVSMGGVAAVSAGFVPAGGWPELEEARAAHERALAEHAGVEAGGAG